MKKGGGGMGKKKAGSDKTTMLIWDYDIVEDEVSPDVLGDIQGLSHENAFDVISDSGARIKRDDLAFKFPRNFANNRSARNEWVEKKTDSDLFKKNMKNYLLDMQSVFDEIAATSTGFQLDEIELHLMVNGSGSIGLVGKVAAGMETGIKVRFKRKGS